MSTAPTNNIFIPFEFVGIGAFEALKNAEYYRDQAQRSFEEKLFQVSVSLSTIAIEEAMKGVELSINAKNKLSMTFDEWNTLKKHKYKLTASFNRAITAFENASEDELKKVTEMRNELGINSTDKNDIIKELKKTYSYFLNLIS